MQIPSVHDPSMAPPGMHAASAYAFPVETPRDQHGHLKNEMADRVVDKISRYAPNFKDIQIRRAACVWIASTPMPAWMPASRK